MLKPFYSLKDTMGIPKNIQSFLKAPSGQLSPMQRLCRVMKGPGCYVCGLCGRRYTNPNDAWKCLTSNALNINSLPVIATSNNTQTYLCLLCGKTYTNQEDTALCVIRDLQASHFPKVLGDHFHSLFSALAEKAEKSKRDKLTSRQGTLGSSIPKNVVAYRSPLRLVSSAPPQIKHEEEIDNTNNSESQHLESSEPEVMQAQAEPAVEPPSEETATTGDPMDHEADIRQAPKEEEKPVLYRKPNQKPFSRENAQYRCTVCNEKFFTKMEVENHFLEHPLMDEV